MQLSNPFLRNMTCICRSTAKPRNYKKLKLKERTIKKCPHMIRSDYKEACNTIKKSGGGSEWYAGNHRYHCTLYTFLYEYLKKKDLVSPALFLLLWIFRVKMSKQST